jgi:peptidyl-prolyl cis-trans isomerase D
MAIIGKIREKSWLLVGIVGLAMLAFILENYKSMFGSSGGKYGIGLVDGDKVNVDVYNKLSERVQLQDKDQKAKEAKEYTDEDLNTSNDKAWNFMVDSTLLFKEYQSLNLDVSDNEFNSYLMATDGFSVLQDLNQFFVDSLTGAISEQSMQTGRQKLQQTLNQLKSAKDAKGKSQWEGTKKYFLDRRKNEKYFALVSQGIYVTQLESKEEYRAKKETKTISFVQRKYSEINDAEIKVTDEEIEAYYDEHKSEKKYWNRTDNRELKVFDIAIKPSKSDTLTFNKLIAKLRVDFMASKNDSILIMKESELKMYQPGARGIAVPEGHPKANQYMTYPMDYDTIIKLTPIGQLVGPYRVADKFYFSKLLGFSPSKIKARHLLISFGGSKDAAVLAKKKATADSILKVINKDNFALLVAKHSEDPGSKDKGGEYADFLEGDMVKEFGSYCANAPIGKISIVKTEFGYHIIEVLERDPNKFPIFATVVKSFKPSELTIENMESEANNLLFKIDQKISKIDDISKKIAAFDTLASKSKYFARAITLEDNDPKIFGMTTPNATERLLELAFSDDVEVGNVITAPLKDKDKYVIAMVSAIREKGEPALDDIRERLKKEIIEDKKAKRLMNQMAKTKNLQTLAKKGNTVVEQAQITFANPAIGNAGFEPEIVGALFSGFVKNGQTTLPLQGKSGVYVIRVVKTEKAPSVANYKEEKDQLTTMMKGNIQGLLMGALRKKAEVVDNRKLFPSIRP